MRSTDVKISCPVTNRQPDTRLRTVRDGRSNRVPHQRLLLAPDDVGGEIFCCTIFDARNHAPELIKTSTAHAHSALRYNRGVPEAIDSSSPMFVASVALHELFSTLTAVGFSQDQALSLVATLMERTSHVN